MRYDGDLAELFPIFVNLRGRKVLVVGAGMIGAPKAESLFRAGAEVHVVAPVACKWIQEQASAQNLHWHRREFVDDDLRDVFLCVAATDSEATNHAIYDAARKRRVVCNVVDDPEYCDFFYPAVVRRGALQIAISTSGLSPALARRLRVELERQFGPEYAQWVEQVGRQRREILAREMPANERREMLERIASHDAFKDFLRSAMSDLQDPRD
jgi:precorrin-2 dehydrogenase/sirohydrochlorin ferrochelatase